MNDYELEARQKSRKYLDAELKFWKVDSNCSESSELESVAKAFEEGNIGKHDYFLAGLAQVDQGNYEDAIELFQEALSGGKDVYDRMVLNHISACYWLLGDSVRAIDYDAQANPGNYDLSDMVSSVKNMIPKNQDLEGVLAEKKINYLLDAEIEKKSVIDSDETTEILNAERERLDQEWKILRAIQEACADEDQDYAGEGLGCEEVTEIDRIVRETIKPTPDEEAFDRYIHDAGKISKEQEELDRYFKKVFEEEQEKLRKAVEPSVQENQRRDTKITRSALGIFDYKPLSYNDQLNVLLDDLAKAKTESERQEIIAKLKKLNEQQA